MSSKFPELSLTLRKLKPEVDVSSEPLDDRIKCEVCGKFCGKITIQHLKMHGMSSMDDYRRLYPDAPLVSKTTILKNQVTKTKGSVFSKSEKVIKEVVIKPPPNRIIPKRRTKLEMEEFKELEKIRLEKHRQEVHIAKLPKNMIPVFEPIDDSDPIIRPLTSKNEVYEILSSLFRNLVKDFVIRKIYIGNEVEYEEITDFCIPSHKIIFDFPDTMWHNKNTVPDYIRNDKLKADGWRIIEFLGRHFDIDNFNSLKDKQGSGSRFFENSRTHPKK